MLLLLVPGQRMGGGGAGVGRLPPKVHYITVDWRAPQHTRRHQMEVANVLNPLLMSGTLSQTGGASWTFSETEQSILACEVFGQ